MISLHRLAPNRLVNLFLSILLFAAALSGCIMPPAAERYPVPDMLDPVTEEAPNVIE